MKESQRAAAQVLRPIIDMYRNSAIGLTGCHSQGIARRSCELDVLIVTGERRPHFSTRTGGVFVDLFFVREAELLKPSTAELAVSISRLKTIRDTSLILSTALASNAATSSDSARRSSRSRLASSLKALGRVDDALSTGLLPDADFWLLTASYDFVRALLHSKEVLPAPSHVLEQMRGQSRGLGRHFEAFSNGAGLEASSRASCATRLEALAILHDVLGRADEGLGAARSAWSAERLVIVRAKASELAAESQHAEAYSFLGQETVRALTALAVSDSHSGKRKAKKQMIMSSLASEKGGLLSGRLLKELGISRKRASVESAFELLREQVSSLARKV